MTEFVITSYVLFKDSKIFHSSGPSVLKKKRTSEIILSLLNLYANFLFFLTCYHYCDSHQHHKYY
jgi:hypothetical protein